ncbi:hypothetical protein PSAB6_350042 [Paraburkholderia sabiae]|nr:hypothetical protein PSAB6_350042 [Paraburkholderia sabiae]
MLWTTWGYRGGVGCGQILGKHAPRPNVDKVIQASGTRCLIYAQGYPFDNPLNGKRIWPLSTDGEGAC